MEPINGHAATDRRTFLRTAAFATGGMIGAPGTIATAGTSKHTEATAEMMQEHGILHRTLLVCQHCVIKLRANQANGLTKPLNETAQIFRRFGEDYQERAIEEKFVFPMCSDRKPPISKYPAILVAQHSA